jgi:hypothetical protein
MWIAHQTPSFAVDFWIAPFYISHLPYKKLLDRQFAFSMMPAALLQCNTEYHRMHMISVLFLASL